MKWLRTIFKPDPVAYRQRTIGELQFALVDLMLMKVRVDHQLATVREQIAALENSK